MYLPKTKSNETNVLEKCNIKKTAEKRETNQISTFWFSMGISKIRIMRT